ncbi:MAG: hypothetical protein E7049_06435 [Lentisphaerae bacterium]|jgi:hypothetical protein|nr:hypothetical protein [Lentisphaerota bacterium]
MSDITTTPLSTKKMFDVPKSFENSVNKLLGGDGQKTKEVISEVANILSGDNVRVSKGSTTGVDGNRDTTKTNGSTGVPSLDNPGDTVAREINLEKLFSYLQLDNEERQTAMAKDRIQLQQGTLDAEHEERMDQINDSIKKMKEAESASKWSRAFGWIGAIVSVIAAVALTIVTGGAAAGFAIAGAVLAVTSLVLNETGAMDTITKSLAESLQESFGMSKSRAQLAASLIINVGIIALSAGCSIGGMVAGMSNAASAAAKVGETAAKAVDIATKTAKESSNIFGISTQTAKLIQNIISTVGIGTSAASLAASGAGTYYSKRSDDAKAETTELEKFITQLQQRLDESEEELQALIQLIQAGLSEIAQMVGSATDTSSEIANNMGNMA